MAAKNSFEVYQLKPTEDNRDLLFSSMRELRRQADSFRSAVYNVLVQLEPFEYASKMQAEDHARKLSKLEIVPNDDPLRITFRDSAGRVASINLQQNAISVAVDSCDTHELDSLTDSSRYQLIYTGELPDTLAQTKDGILEELFTRLNLSIPDGYRGHSLSVSDIIGIRMDGEISYHFVDSVGFVRLADFIPDEHPSLQEQLTAAPSQHAHPKKTKKKGMER